MSHKIPTTERPLTTVLTAAAATAGRAPSVHNAQPWRWRVLPDALELRVARDPELAVTDPESRLLTLSCGAALHHARMVMAAEGWTPVVERLPNPAEPELLARLTSPKRSDSDPDATRLARYIPGRHTDRRPVSGEHVSSAALDEITGSATAGGGRLQILDSN